MSTRDARSANVTELLDVGPGKGNASNDNRHTVVAGGQHPQAAADAALPGETADASVPEVNRLALVRSCCSW